MTHPHTRLYELADRNVRMNTELLELQRTLPPDPEMAEKVAEHIARTNQIIRRLREDAQWEELKRSEIL